MPKLPVGITVMPEYAQSEGIGPVLDRLEGLAKATCLTTSPYVARPAEPGRGHREPPGDAGAGERRLLDRPLWGKRELWMEATASFVPDAALYEGLAYRPLPIDDQTHAEGAIVGDFLDAAAARGMETWLQVQAAIPPGHRVQFGNPLHGDHPLMPDGTPGPARIDRNASLASDELRAYMRAFITDLCRAYPQAGGLKFDWPEYPAYTFESLFFDFNPAVAPIAKRLGLDLATLARGAADFLADLSGGKLREKPIATEAPDAFLASLFDAYPVLAEMLALKAAVVADYARFLKETMDTASGGHKRMFLQCFPPPLNQVTGFDFRKVGTIPDMVGIKFYTMHWPVIERSYITALTARTGIAPNAAARAISRLLRLSPDAPRDAGAIRYPEPGDLHPAGSADLAAKIAQARLDMPPSTRLVSIAHGYGPVDDVMRRFRAVTTGDGLHVNRYCYLSDEKLAAIGQRFG